MKQEDIRNKAREELSALSIIGIKNVGALREAQAKRKPDITAVDSTTVKVDIRSNYYKADNDVSDILAKHQTVTEQVVYARLYRLSYGFRKNTCSVGQGALAKACNIRSANKTIGKAINGLIEKGHIAIIQKHGNNKAGTKYRVYLPCEIHQLESSTVVKTTVVENAVVNSTVVENAFLAPVNSTVVENTPVAQTRSESESESTVVNSTVVENTPIKDLTYLKDSLSPDPVKLFYNSIGQKRISKTKRERGNKVVQELENDGFSPEDIAYAAQWTPKNAKEEVYDMEILKHTIGEAISARAVERKTTDAAREKADRIKAAEEERRRLEGEIQEMRSRMTEDELVELREKALEEIRNTDGIKEQFITEMLITAKENEILLRGKPTNSL